MSATLIGYMAKRIAQRPDWLAASSVIEICSVSDCISKPAEGWTEAWEDGRLNAWGLFHSPEEAEKLVPEATASEYDIFAYELELVRYVEGIREEIAVQTPGEILPATGFRVIGYDVVSGELGGFFECSPLSCNSWSEEVETNEYCLVDGSDRAHKLAAVAEASGCEPGDYFVVRVRRRGRDG
jgi:hypothetical protein